MSAFGKRCVVTAGIFALAVSASAHAQTRRSHLGARIGYNFDVEEVALGVQFSTPIAKRLEFYPSFDYYFVDRGSLWALNGDLKYRVTSNRSADWLYVGAGVGVSRASVGPAHDSNVGLNLLAGFEPLRGRIHPFGEGRLKLGDGSSFQIAAGLNFTLGRH